MIVHGNNAMKNPTIALAVILVLMQPAAGSPDAPDRSADRAQISEILARWEHAWNTHDMKAFGTMFHEDGTWILWTGAVWVGRQAIADGHAAVHKTVFRNSIQRERLEELTFVGPDSAVVRFCSTLEGDERNPEKLVRSRKFLVVTKRAGIWGVSWGQNTRLADTVPDSECFAELRKKTSISHRTGSLAPVPGKP
jgi:uncharacterized protein (TIGR02246 family)